MFRSLQWLVMVRRATEKEDKKARYETEVRDAEKQLKASSLPGNSFDPDEMEAMTAAEPRNVPPNARLRGQYTVGLSILALVVFAGSTAAWSASLSGV